MLTNTSYVAAGLKNESLTSTQSRRGAKQDLLAKKTAAPPIDALSTREVLHSYPNSARGYLVRPIVQTKIISVWLGAFFILALEPRDATSCGPDPINSAACSTVLLGRSKPLLPRWNRPCGGLLRVTHDYLAGVAPRTFRALVGNFSLPTKTRPPVLTDRQIRPEGAGDTY